MREKLTAMLKESGAAQAAVIGRRVLCALHRDAALERAEELIPGFQSLIIAAYPYGCEDTPKGVSMYAAAKDYHRVIPSLMASAASELEKAGYRAKIMADISPFDERACASAAGLGMRGDNGLIIVPEYGSYIFLATILTDAPLAADDAREEKKQCLHCGACRAACPYGALGEDGFDAEKCLSELSQRRHLTERQLEMLRENGVIWGCDRCQAACPYNRGAARTNIAGFLENRLSDADICEMETLSNREFEKKYGKYALSWRGAAVLRRNIANLRK